MSKEELIKAGCEGKDKMPRDKAQALAKRQRKKGVKVEAYRCSFCAKWHIGTPEFVAHKDTWTPRPERERDRPTDQRRAKGEWTWVTTDKAGQKAARDLHAHPIDQLEHSGQLSNDQASAARDFEQLFRAAKETPGIRDSTTLWEPQGHHSDDGNVRAVTERSELYLFLGTIRDRQLRRVCVEHTSPRPHEIGLLREALNECCRFFGYGRRK